MPTTTTMLFVATAGAAVVAAAAAGPGPLPRLPFTQQHHHHGSLRAGVGANDECSGVTDKQDCGHVGTQQPDCEAAGCCWVPAPGTSDPWCFHKPGDITTCPLNYTSTGAPFSSDEVQQMRGYFLNNININGSGAVVAAPDYNTPGGSYYFHWERDGALSMGALLETAKSVDDVKDLMDSYSKWVSKVQNEDDPHGIDVLAEPKYMIPSGDVFSGSWCRPQNDGPGLRAHTLVNYANALQQAGHNDAADDLWPMISKDLDWAAANFNANGCDLWEEIQSNDFFWNKFTTRAALSKGSAFAKAQGDDNRATTYANAASTIASSLGDHVVNGMVIETQSRQKDAAVICAFNDGYLGDNVFSPSGKEAAGTVQALNELFCGSFQINQQDTKDGVPGILYGRYEGDNYAGGNPWILLTSALAELLYNGATDMVRHADADYSHWTTVLSMDSSDGADALAVAEAMVGSGDGVLTRLRKHVQPNGFHLTEQIDRNSGECMAAKDLTWSYATTLKAMHAREQYFEALKSL